MNKKIQKSLADEILDESVNGALDNAPYRALSAENGKPIANTTKHVVALALVYTNDGAFGQYMIDELEFRDPVAVADKIRQAGARKGRIVSSVVFLHVLHTEIFLRALDKNTEIFLGALDKTSKAPEAGPIPQGSDPDEHPGAPA